MYAMVATWPDLAYVIGATNRYMSNPRNKHQEAVKHIFQYLPGAKDIQLTFGLDYPNEVEGFTDFDYVGNFDNQKLTSGYVLTYEGGSISWRPKIQ